MKAYLHNYRQSPRKVRLVASLLKGKNVGDALVELDFLAKRASEPLKKLLSSAIANAKNLGKEVENLYIKEFRVDKGVTMRRMMPAAMGTGHRINKRTSNIIVTLEEKLIAIKATKKEKIKKSPATKKVSKAKK